MSEIELNPFKKQIIHLIFEDGTSDFQIELRAKNIARHVTENPRLGEFTKIGTIVFYDVETTGLKPELQFENLNGDEILLELLTIKHLESIE